MIDLGGRTVIPGLIDSHLYVSHGGLIYNAELRWDGVPSLADALRLFVSAACVFAATATYMAHPASRQPASS